MSGRQLGNAYGWARGLLMSKDAQDFKEDFSSLSLAYLKIFLFSTAAAPPQTTRRFMRGEYVVEYKGTLLSYSEASVSLLFITFHFM